MAVDAPDAFSASTPLFIVANAGSGHDAADDTRAAMTKVFTAAGRSHEFVLIEKGGDVVAAAQDAVERARAVRGAVIAAGGDGTISAVAQQAADSGVLFGIVPLGTFNYFARVHGVPQDAAAAARALLTATPQPTQVGCVNNRSFLVNASLGLYPELLEDREAYKQRYGRSRLVALVSGLRSLLREQRQLHLEFGIDGEIRRIKTPTLFVGNNRLQLERVGLDDAAALDDGHLVAVHPRPIGALAMLGLTLRGALGRLGDADQVQSLVFRELEVRPRRWARRRIKVGIDGEIVWMRLPLRFRAKPGALQFLMPAPAARAAVE
ncbi:diacylglycerol/lipid kinase family protein [Solimonas marina]|uniref:Diacylglycerol kinase n=1 Tax=Solimonas marina TaxID=2714601 RepID=A0A970B6G6_9GAMM|nr:diacylglycerol kinase family protein [Solimonas marina]NKF24457.1 diacylglycerol kinase [Solimonas marina]